MGMQMVGMHVLMDCYTKNKSRVQQERFILDKKKICNEKQFYYDADRTSEYVLNEASKEGCDALNACIGGLNMFDSFIGLEDDTDQSRVKE